MWGVSPGIESITSALEGSLDHWKTDCTITQKNLLSTTKLWISQQGRGIILFTSVFSKQGLVFGSGSVPGSRQISGNCSFQAGRRRQLHGLPRTCIAGVLDFPRLTWFSPKETVCSTPAFEKRISSSKHDVGIWEGVTFQTFPGEAAPSAHQCSREGSYCEVLAANTRSSWVMGVLAGQGNRTLTVCITPPKIIYHQKHLV